MLPPPRPNTPSPPSPLAQSAQGDVRVGPLAAIPALVTELGGSPRRVFARAGVSLPQFRNPDSRLAMERLARLIEEATVDTGEADFAMIAGLRFDMRGLGLIGELMQHSATVGDGLRELVLHLHLHDRGATPVLMQLDADTMLLGYSVYHFGTPSLDLVYDTSTGILLRVLEALCGPEFRAKAIQVTTQGRSRSASYRRHFGCSVRFNSAVSGVVFASQWMDRPVAGADPSRHDEVQQSLAAAEASSPMTFGQRIEVVTQQMLLSGTATGPAIALLFGMSERSLRRQLAREGMSLRGLLNRTRFALACQMLQYTKLSVAQVAMALQYRDANAFSRAFHGWAGLTAMQWRAMSAGKPRHSDAIRAGR